MTVYRQGVNSCHRPIPIGFLYAVFYFKTKAADMKHYAMGRAFEVGSDKEHELWMRQKPLYDCVQKCGELHLACLKLANEIAELELKLMGLIEKHDPMTECHGA